MQQVLGALLDEIRRAWPFRWVGFIVASVALGCATIVTLLMPDVFTSQARISIYKAGDQAPLVIHNAEIRLLDDGNLDAILDRVPLGLDAKTSADRQNAREALRQQITLDGIDSDVFTISCRNGEAQRARAVCLLLVTAFEKAIAQNGDSVSLKDQLADLQAALSAAEKSLDEYRIAHLDIFGQGGIETRLDAARAVLEKAKSDYVASMQRRDQFRAFWLSAPSEQRDLDANAIETPTGDPLIERLYTAYTQLEDLRTRFSEDHPDVIAARKQIETVINQYPPGVRMCTRTDDAQGAAAPSASPAPATDASAPTVIDRATVNAVAANIAVCRSLAALTEADRAVDTLTKLNLTAPPIEEELARRTTERDGARDRVDAMRRRVQELDATGGSTNSYTVVATPDLPGTPTSPNRPNWLIVALAASLFAGTGFAYFRGRLAGALVSPREVRESFKLPFYGAVSEIEGLRSRIDQSAQVISFFIAVAAIIAAMLVLILADPYITAARHLVTGTAAAIVHFNTFTHTPGLPK